jgi:hypothetical protein
MGRASSARSTLCARRERDDFAGSLLPFAHAMGKKYAGTPLAKYFITSES